MGGIYAAKNAPENKNIDSKNFISIDEDDEISNHKT